MTSDVQKYDYVDALRGWAILAVIMVHASNAVAPSSSILQRLTVGGAYGVQLFYILSAITLCMSWETRHGHETFPVRNFFIRRFFRVAPLFYLAIVFYLLLYGFEPRASAPNGIEWWFVPLTFLFLHGIHPETITSVVPGGWSIAVEMTFYLVLPFLLRRLTSSNSYVVLLAISMAAYALSVLMIEHLWSDAYPAHQQYLVSAFSYLNFFSQAPVFVVGMLAYRTCAQRTALPSWAILAMMTVTCVMLMTLYQPDHSMAHLLPSHIVMGCVFASLSVLLARFPVRLLVNTVTTYLGRVSFSMYLIHFAVIELCARLGIVTLLPHGDIPCLLFFLFIVAATAFLASFTYVIIERQGVLLGNRLINRLERTTRLNRVSELPQPVQS